MIAYIKTLILVLNIEELMNILVENKTQNLLKHIGDID